MFTKDELLKMKIIAIGHGQLNEQSYCFCDFYELEDHKGNTFRIAESDYHKITETKEIIINKINS